MEFEEKMRDCLCALEKLCGVYDHEIFTVEERDSINKMIWSTVKAQPESPSKERLLHRMRQVCAPRVKCKTALMNWLKEASADLLDEEDHTPEKKAKITSDDGDELLQQVTLTDIEAYLRVHATQTEGVNLFAFEDSLRAHGVGLFEVPRDEIDEDEIYRRLSQELIKLTPPDLLEKIAKKDTESWREFAQRVCRNTNSKDMSSRGLISGGMVIPQMTKDENYLQSTVKSPKEEDIFTTGKRRKSSKKEVPILFDHSSFWDLNLWFIENTPTLKVLYDEFLLSRDRAVVSQDFFKYTIDPKGTSVNGNNNTPQKLTGIHWDWFDDQLQRTQAVFNLDEGAVRFFTVPGTHTREFRRLLSAYANNEDIMNPTGFRTFDKLPGELLTLLYEYAIAPPNGYLMGFSPGIIHFESAAKSDLRDRRIYRKADSKPIERINQTRLRLYIGTHVPVGITDERLELLAKYAKAGYIPAAFTIKKSRSQSQSQPLDVKKNMLHGKSSMFLKMRTENLPEGDARDIEASEFNYPGDAYRYELATGRQLARPRRIQ